MFWNTIFRLIKNNGSIKLLRLILIKMKLLLNNKINQKKKKKEDLMIVMIVFRKIVKISNSLKKDQLKNKVF